MGPLRRRPVDLIVSALIVVALVIAGAAVWYFQFRTAHHAGPGHRLAGCTAYPVDVPARLIHRWTAESEATRSPQVTDTAVLTGHDGAVRARDPRTGRAIWGYERPLPICGLLAAWSPTTPTALAAYANSRGCSEITALDAHRGVRRGTRSSDADNPVVLQSDGGYVLSLGRTRAETWGSNLVRGIEYGRIDARVKPDMGRHDGHDCRLTSGMTAGDRVALVEHCAGDPGFRLTVIGALLDKDEKIPLYGSAVITSGTAFAAPVVVGMSESGIAVYDGGANSPSPPRRRSAPSLPTGWRPGATPCPGDPRYPPARCR